MAECGGIASRSLTAGTATVSLDGQGFGSYTVTSVGTPTVTATVKDAARHTARYFSPALNSLSAQLSYSPVLLFPDFFAAGEEI